MASKFFKAFNFFKKKGTVAPTVTQPRQLKTTMKKIRSQYERYGFDKGKTATDRANIVRRKKSVERMEKLDKAKAKRKEGIKASKDIKKMVDTGQADKVGGSVYHRSIREKKFMGGLLGKDKKKETKKDKPKSIKDKIVDPKKKKRLEELRKDLGMKKGGKAKFPDLTGDGKVTQADILKGRGVFKKGGGVKKMVKTVTSPITHLRNKMSKRKFGSAKGKK